VSNAEVSSTFEQQSFSGRGPKFIARGDNSKKNSRAKNYNILGMQNDDYVDNQAKTDVLIDELRKMANQQ